jgi:hypothetical protein
MWSWEDQLGDSANEQGWKQSRDYTSAILKDTSRRIMQKIHAVEKLECFEVLIEIWETDEVPPEMTDLTAGTQSFSISLWFAQDPERLQGEPHLFVVRRCTEFPNEPVVTRTSEKVQSIHSLVFSNISDTDSRTTASLISALFVFIQQIELSSVAEMNHECLSLLKECISSVSAFKNLYADLLKLATVYGEKLDDSVIVDKKKMRRDFGVITCTAGLTCRNYIFVCSR